MSAKEEFNPSTGTLIVGMVIYAVVTIAGIATVLYLLYLAILWLVS
jgi:hypothetical protein